MKPRFKRLGTKTHFMTGRLMFPKLGETCQHRFHPFKTHLQKCGASGGGPPSWKNGVCIRPWSNRYWLIYWRAEPYSIDNSRFTR